MARALYGCTSADFTLTAGGRLSPGAVLTLWTARTGGTRITDLLTVDDVPITEIVSGSDASIAYQGPDNDKSVHWADSGVGARVAIRPVDITGEAGPGSGILTTKGDLLVRSSSADTRQPAGPDGTLVAYDSTQATGLRWVSAGNLLTPNQASGGAALASTSGFLSSALAHHTFGWDAAAGGVRIQKTTTSASRHLIATGAGSVDANGVPASGVIPVTPGQAITVMATVWSDVDPAGVGRIRTYGFAGATLVSALAHDTFAWGATPLLRQATLVVPSGVSTLAFATGRDTVSTASGVGHVQGVASVHLGAGGLWVPPGVPVPNLGVRADPANSAQVQVWNQVTSTWVTV